MDKINTYLFSNRARHFQYTIRTFLPTIRIICALYIRLLIVLFAGYSCFINYLNDITFSNTNKTIKKCHQVDFS